MNIATHAAALGVGSGVGSRDLLNGIEPATGSGFIAATVDVGATLGEQDDIAVGSVKCDSRYFTVSVGSGDIDMPTTLQHCTR